jgi:hypothetical protein
MCLGRFIGCMLGIPPKGNRLERMVLEQSKPHRTKSFNPEVVTRVERPKRKEK